MLKKSVLAFAAMSAVMIAAPAAMAQSLSVDGSLNGDLQIASVSGTGSIEGLSYSGVESQVGGGYALSGNWQQTGVHADQSVSTFYNDVDSHMNADGYNLNVSGVVSGGNALGSAEGLSGFDASMTNDGLAAALDIEIDADIGF